MEYLDEDGVELEFCPIRYIVGGSEANHVCSAGYRYRKKSGMVFIGRFIDIRVVRSRSRVSRLVLYERLREARCGEVRYI
jgi:hypothetical protein